MVIEAFRNRLKPSIGPKRIVIDLLFNEVIQVF